MGSVAVVPRVRARWVVTSIAVAVAALAGASAASAAPTRYSLVHGCYSVTSGGQPVPGADRVRMQATALGHYLLYRPDRRFVAARPGGGVGIDPAPGPAADWRGGGGGGGPVTPTPQSGGAAV